MSHMSNGQPYDEAQVMDEIAYFEARLSAMCYSGDCGYEKSLARTYDCLLRQRRELLEELRGAGSDH